MDDASRLCSLEDSQRSGGTTEVEQATVAGEDVLDLTEARVRTAIETATSIRALYESDAADDYVV
ncbi:hypothetical protein MHZ93_21025 [Roseomonas sp. ACRSG]|nr:hypothetical protein [Roseomonas sp. ACRSG]